MNPIKVGREIAAVGAEVGAALPAEDLKLAEKLFAESGLDLGKWKARLDAENPEIAADLAKFFGPDHAIPAINERFEALRKIGTDVSPTASIHPDALIGKNVTIGDHVQILHGAVIADGVKILDKASIGPGARIELNSSIGFNTFIGDGAHVGPHARVGNNVTVSHHAFVGSKQVVRDREIIP